jgi:hypothetical protein
MTTATETDITDEQATAKGLVKLNTHLDVDVFVDPDTGKFLAKFSQGNGAKWFERDSIYALRTLITQSVFPFSGKVVLAYRPSNLIATYEIDRLHESLDDSEKSYNRIYAERPVGTVTGVAKVSRGRRGEQIFYFRRDDGKTESVEDGQCVRPDPKLDREFYDLAQEYLKNQIDWQARFEEIRNKYKHLSPQQIVDELRTQGARTGRA